MASQIAALFKPKPKYRSRNGVTAIKRDGYGGDWFSLVKEVKERDGYRCLKCSAPEDPAHGVYHDVHHIRELSRGGRTVKSNLLTICKKCHARKHTHLHKSGYTTGSKARSRKT